MVTAMTPAEQIKAWRSRHTIAPVPDTHPDFGPILRCLTDGIRVHWIVRGYRHDTDEAAALIRQEYGGLWSNPKLSAIERIVAIVDHDEDEEYEGNPEGDPTLNGAFR